MPRTGTAARAGRARRERRPLTAWRRWRGRMPSLAVRASQVTATTAMAGSRLRGKLAAGPVSLGGHGAAFRAYQPCPAGGVSALLGRLRARERRLASQGKRLWFLVGYHAPSLPPV
jgi:hypothetical protein